MYIEYIYYSNKSRYLDKTCASHLLGQEQLSFPLLIGIVTGLTEGCFGARFSTRARTFSVLQNTERSPGVYPACIALNTRDGGLLSGVKPPGPVTDCSSRSSAEMKNGWSSASDCLLCLHGLHRGRLTLIFNTSSSKCSEHIVSKIEIGPWCAYSTGIHILLLNSYLVYLDVENADFANSEARLSAFTLSFLEKGCFNCTVITP